MGWGACRSCSPPFCAMSQKENHFMPVVVPLTQILVFGLKDSWNPYALSVICLFVLWISIWRASGITHFFMMVIFILTYAILTFLLNLGYFSFIYATPWINNSIFVLNWIVPTILVIMGGIIFVDWMRMKKSFEGNVIVPLLGLNPASGAIIRERGQLAQINVRKLDGHLIFISSLFALICALQVSTWPFNTDILPYFMEHAKEGNVMEGMVLLGVYLGANIFLLILSCAALSLVRKRSGQKYQEKYISYFRIVLSALCLATGVGLFSKMLF